MAGKKGYNKRSQKYFKKKSRKAPKVSKSVKLYVKKSIHSQIENKRIQWSNSFAFGSNTTTYSTLSYLKLTPSTISYSMAQGFGQADRVGNKCRVMKATFRYILLPISYDLIANPTPKPQHIQLLFGNIKGNQRSDPTAGTVNLLFQNGNIAAAPTGLLGDALRPINNDLWQIKKRIQHKIGYAVSDGTGGNANSSFHSNNDFAYNVMRTIDLTPMFPKVIVYDENSLTPNTNALYLMLQSLNADNTSQLADTAPCGITFWLDLVYEDA